jgi:hypothetical protein
MGMDFSGVLFYGIVLDNNSNREYDGDYDEDDSVESGNDEGETEKGELDLYELENEYFEKVSKIEKDKFYWEKRREFLDKCPIYFGTNLVGDEESVHFICIKTTHRESDWGKVIELEPSFFVILKEWDTQLKQVFDVLGLEYKQPKWVLSSSYSH